MSPVRDAGFTSALSGSGGQVYADDGADLSSTLDLGAGP